MWIIAGFQMPGYQLDMYPGDHFPHHFHLSSGAFDVRILYRQSNAEGVISYTEVWRTDKRREWKPLSTREEKALLDLIDTFFDQLEAEWTRLHE